MVDTLVADDDKDEIYKKYLEILKNKFIAKYDALGLRASGKFAESLEAQTSKSTLTLWGAKHARIMEFGRRAGKFPPREDIEEWIETKKNLPAIFREKKKQMAFLIARKIAKEGITVPNKYNKGDLVKSVVDDFLASDIQKMFDELGSTYLKNIQSDILTIIKAL